MDATFPKDARLLASADYNYVFKNQSKVVGRYSLILFAKNNNSKPRLGLAIAKKKIARAVDRNKVKRIIRESFRHKQDIIGGFDIIVLAKGNLGNVAKPEMRKYFDEQWIKLANSQNS